MRIPRPRANGPAVSQPALTPTRSGWNAVIRKSDCAVLHAGHHRRPASQEALSMQIQDTPVSGSGTEPPPPRDLSAILVLGVGGIVTLGWVGLLGWSGLRLIRYLAG